MPSSRARWSAWRWRRSCAIPAAAWSTTWSRTISSCSITAARGRSSARGPSQVPQASRSSWMSAAAWRPRCSGHARPRSALIRPQVRHRRSWPLRLRHHASASAPVHEDVHDGGAWDATRAYGATSLWDAVAATAKEVLHVSSAAPLIVITDGVDSASTLTPAEVSNIASRLDVPVYILVVTFDLENAQIPTSCWDRWPISPRGPAEIHSRFATPTSAVEAARQVLSELQHQYVIAFEPDKTPGWHPLVLRTRKPGLFVRTRSGYVVNQ